MKLLFIPGWAFSKEIFYPLVALLNPGAAIGYLNWEQIVFRDYPPEVFDDAVVVGWSLGGMEALHAAAHRKVRGLILISSTACFVKKPGCPGIEESVLREMQEGIKNAPHKTLNRFFKMAQLPSLDKQSTVLFESRAAVFSTNALFAGLEYLLVTDYRECLARIKVPVSLIHGSADQVIPEAQSRFLHGNIHSAKLYAEKETGHALLYQNPQRIAEIIKEYLHDLSPGS